MTATRQRIAVESYSPPVDAVFRTGVAGFVCPAVAPATSTPAAPLPQSLLFTSWHDFSDQFAADGAWRPATWLPDAYLWAGVQGFFGNGGQRCWVVLYAPGTDPLAALATGIDALSQIDDVDLVCAPSLMASPRATELALTLVRAAQRTDEDAQHVARADWFLVLDPPNLPAAQVPDQLPAWLAGLRGAALRPADAALYYPWLVPGGDYDPPPGDPAPAGGPYAPVPPSGHVAGIYARTDQLVGVHKAPANEAIDGIVDVAADVDDVAGANPIVALPGRGLRVWGARTIAVPAGAADGNAFISVRRLVLSLSRWLVLVLEWTAFETNSLRTWVRVERELTARLDDLFRAGALQGGSPAEAYYVKCDAENNPDDMRASGYMAIDVGLAVAVPKEFITIRLVRSADGITVA